VVVVVVVGRAALHQTGHAQSQASLARVQAPAAAPAAVCWLSGVEQVLWGRHQQLLHVCADQVLLLLLLHHLDTLVLVPHGCLLHDFLLRAWDPAQKSGLDHQAAAGHLQGSGHLLLHRSPPAVQGCWQMHAMQRQLPQQLRLLLYLQL
jgi:hypothetical protein